MWIVVMRTLDEKGPALWIVMFQMMALDNGSAELHTVSPELRQQQPLEADFLAHYTERF